MYKLVLLIGCFLLEHVSSEEVIVDAPAGQMKGVTMESQKGHTIYAFRGIPYAEPPLGPLRFKDPVPKSKWSGVLDATDDGHSCPQYEVLFKNLNQSEDCLVLNVYSRNINGNAPVMFYIHGGGHLFGTSNSKTLGPRYLLNHEVVLVSINYRLGVFGLAVTDNGDATGNYLFKDIILALKWVQTNIKSFGGNPDCVTIFGQSAGSYTTTTLVASPMARGLFHRAIGLGAAATSMISYKSKYWTRKMAEDVGCGNEANVIECMRNVPWETIVAAAIKWEEGNLITLRFNLVVEDDFGQEMYMPAHPSEYYLKGDFARIPFMMSQTKDEFELLAAFVFYADSLKHIIDIVNTDFESVAPILCQYNPNISDSKAIAAKLRKHYLNDQPVTESNIRDFGKLLTDSFVNHGVHRIVNLVRKFSDIYYFRYDYENDFTYMTLTKGPKLMEGSMHGDELQFLFDFKEAGYIEQGSDEEKLLDLMTGIFTRFAATGNPNEPGKEDMWKPSNSDEFSIAFIDMPDGSGKIPTANKEPFSERYQIWYDLFNLKM